MWRKISLTQAARNVCSISSCVFFSELQVRISHRLCCLFQIQGLRQSSRAQTSISTCAVDSSWRQLHTRITSSDDVFSVLRLHNGSRRIKTHSARAHGNVEIQILYIFRLFNLLHLLALHSAAACAECGPGLRQPASSRSIRVNLKCIAL